MGGGQIGYDKQFSPNWVFGIEANYSFLDTGSYFVNRGLGSVTGRLGYTWGPALLYVKGGYGWADSRFTNGFGGTNGGGPDGYTVGGGLEYLFTQNWSGKVEYQYYDFGTRNAHFASGAGSSRGGFRNDEHTIKAGMNYRFNLVPRSPRLPRDTDLQSHATLTKGRLLAGLFSLNCIKHGERLEQKPGSGINASLILFTEKARFRAAVSSGLPADMVKSRLAVE